MKSFTTIITLFAVLVFSKPADAVLYTVQTGNFFFNPSTLNNVHPGDTIRWVWVAGSHTTTSSTIPSGAAGWDEPITSSSTTYDYIPVVTGTYNYVCTPHAGMGQIGNFTVVALPNPLTVTATADDNNLCNGESTWLRATASGGSGSYTYSWTSVPPGFFSSQQNVQISPEISRTYQVTVTSGAQNASSSVAVSVTQPPVASAGSDTTYCINVTQIPVEGTASGFGSATWTSTGDGTFTNPTGLTGFYTPGPSDLTMPFVDLILTVTAVAPCSGNVTDSVHIVLDPCTGIGGKKQENALKIYPNPSSGSFNVSGISGSGSILKIYDIQGRVLVEQPVSPGTFMQHVEINGNGVYEVKLFSGSEIAGGRVIISR